MKTMKKLLAYATKLNNVINFCDTKAVCGVAYWGIVYTKLKIFFLFFDLSKVFS